jgi:plasmid replication initiation protein
MSKDITLKKNSAIIQISCKELTIIQRKLINAIIWCIQTNQNELIYEISLSEIKKMCGIQATDNVNLKYLFKGLRDISLEFNYLNKDKHHIWSSMSFLSAVEIDKEPGRIKFEMPEMLKEKIRYPHMYAPLNMLLIAGFKCSYAIILYELLRDYLAAPKIPLISIEDYRTLMGIKEHEYRGFKNFRVKVITPAVEELNEKSDLTCSYKLIKKQFSNKYEYIQFQVSKKAKTSTYETNENIDYSMDLFEDLAVQANKPVVQIPEDIMSAVPEGQRTEALKDLLSRFLEKGNEYVISNIKYSLKHFPENFIGYLKVALENDYARNDRDVKAKIKEAAVKKSRQIEQKEKANRAAHNDHAEILKKIESLAPDKLEPLHKKCDEIVIKSGIKPEFLTDTVKESLMIEAYRALHVVSVYSALDQD